MQFMPPGSQPRCGRHPRTEPDIRVGFKRRQHVPELRLAMPELHLGSMRETLNVNLMAHDNREHILMYTQSILKRSDNNVFATGYAGSICGRRSDDRKRGTRCLLR
jgi:hypothetical protein